MAFSQHDDDIIFSISDNGIGIPGSDLEEVFQRFYRTDLRRGDQGLGLSLSFSSAVCRAHNGQTKLESKLNQGSKFTVILPKINSR